MAWRASAVIGRIIKVAFQLASSVALAAIGTGCTTTTVHTFYKVQNPVVDRAFVKPGVDWSTYRHLQPDSLSIVYVEGGEKPDPADLERMRMHFREAFLAARGDDYEITSLPDSYPR